MKIGIVQVALSHGGAEQVGVMLANGLRQHGHDSFMLTDLNEPIVYRVDDSVPVYHFAGKKTNTLLKWLKAFSLDSLILIKLCHLTSMCLTVSELKTPFLLR